jgi:predicted thioesterase
MGLQASIKPGIRGYKELIVSREDTAARWDSGLLEVFATPALVALMENTALMSYTDLLPEGYTSVGAEITVRHVKATPVGMKVFCESVLREVEASKLVFEISASDEQGPIGFGTHIRFIVNEKKFMDRLKG